MLHRSIDFGFVNFIIDGAAWSDPTEYFSVRMFFISEVYKLFALSVLMLYRFT